MSDGGYHAWRALQYPLKHCGGDRDLARWSKRLESVRKDVEYSFGILKGRFRILKMPIAFCDKTQVDNIFFTCCVIHNDLLVHDSNDLSSWDLEGQDGTFGGDGCLDLDDTYDEFLGVEDLDATLQGGSDATEFNTNVYEMEQEEGHYVLASKLAKHFKMQWEKHEVEWINSKEVDEKIVNEIDW